MASPLLGLLLASDLQLPGDRECFELNGDRLVAIIESDSDLGPVGLVSTLGDREDGQWGAVLFAGHDGLLSGFSLGFNLPKRFDEGTPHVAVP